jgi:hypothetical protein
MMGELVLAAFFDYAGVLYLSLAATLFCCLYGGDRIRTLLFSRALLVNDLGNRERTQPLMRVQDMLESLPVCGTISSVKTANSSLGCTRAC